MEIEPNGINNTRVSSAADRARNPSLEEPGMFFTRPQLVQPRGTAVAHSLPYGAKQT